MDQAIILARARGYVQQLLATDKSGHDWFHIDRVVRTALKIADTEGGNRFLIELAALFHDLADWKLHPDPDASLQLIRDWLAEAGVEPVIADEVVFIASHVSYKGGTNTVRMRTLEGWIVQDADMLDGVGAIGIARTFAYGSSIGRPMYDPEVPPRIGVDFGTYRAHMDENTTINYFYEKLLLVRDRVNTPTARRMAAHMHAFMELFLQEFYAQWAGELE
jgi:uncharacterized protein